MNKKLAYAIWAMSVLELLGFVAIYAVIGFEYVDILTILVEILSIATQALLGYVVLRDINDRFVFGTIIANALFRFNIAGIVAIIIRLIMRKKEDVKKLRKLWIVPGIVAGAIALISILSQGIFATSLAVLSAVLLVTNVVFYFVFGYWFIKYLK